ncbi:response regulator [Geothrix limicola]|uniref:Response regulator n=1 Tax=Geothrix limicola TaxID=2927978 RepID=A0ABQ5QDZ1_9BACT|nr:response regulator [Geothrix limicola]GLH72878.1 response regulator [Geothrix limicola]
MVKILVIDDSTLMRNILRDNLEGAGFEVEDLPPKSSAALINHLNTSTPDLVISDFNMPILNGEGVIKAVRFSNPKIPILILTANRDAKRDTKLKAMGVRNILYKPIHAEDLLGAVNRICQQQKLNSKA